MKVNGENLRKLSRIQISLSDPYRDFKRAERSTHGERSYENKSTLVLGKCI